MQTISSDSTASDILLCCIVYVYILLYQRYPGKEILFELGVDYHLGEGYFDGEHN